MTLIRGLLKAGAKVNVANDYGSTPLSEAAERADPEALRLLLDAGADAESPNADGQTALMTVARTDVVDAAKVLVAHGAKVNASEKWRGQTALMWASAQSRAGMVQFLVAHGADVNARESVRDWPRRGDRRTASTESSPRRPDAPCCSRRARDALRVRRSCSRPMPISR